MPAYDGEMFFRPNTRLSGSLYPADLVLSGSVSPGNSDYDIPLTREELESLRDDIDKLLHPPKALVMVEVIGVSGTKYTYHDPSGKLQVDDLVRVPFGHSNVSKVAIVRELGSPWTGDTKSVLARFEAEEL